MFVTPKVHSTGTRPGTTKPHKNDAHQNLWKVPGGGCYDVCVSYSG